MTLKARITEDAYSQAVDSGRYVRDTGIHGKYDNVRLYWEDSGTRLFLRPHLDAIVADRVQKLGRVRILDLGCGSGDGYEMLMMTSRRDPGIVENRVHIIQPDYLGLYKGVDVNGELLAQTRQRWIENPKMSFASGDFSKGLPLEEDEDAFDIYFTSFGTLSHLSEDETVRLFGDIIRHAGDGALVVGDWLGRYSYEWQELWNSDVGKEQWMDYVISYIYPPEVRRRRRRKLAHLNLRLLCREEVLRILKRAEKAAGGKLVIRELFDRSIFSGRHMDTGDYNRFVKPLRRVANSLHEDNVRTDLGRLIFDYQPHADFDFLNHFFEELQSCWNTLVRFTMDLCQRFDPDRGTVVDPHPIKPFYPEPLKKAMLDLKRVVEGAGWFQMGDPRANVIEPQLGYALRGLEMRMQKGMGTGHGLVGIFEVRKG
jgi:SAM-dependent methyltransferase